MCVCDELMLQRDIYGESTIARFSQSMVATRVRSWKHNSATVRTIAKIRPSAKDRLAVRAKILFSTKCGEWVVYAEMVTIITHGANNDELKYVHDVW